MDEQLSLVLVGIGGYGNFYVRALLDSVEQSKVRIAGAVDPNPERCERLGELKEMGVPFFPGLEDFYGVSHADLAVISAPIHYHAAQIVQALRRGTNVLCEKPMCATVPEGEAIIREKDKSGKVVAIGYQWSYSKAIQNLKHDVLNGTFGKPKRLKTLVLWPRDFNYFGRNNWAGRIKDKAGNWILDSVASNATAHFLHNMFYVLGHEVDRSAPPLSVEAQVYKAYDIETYDTIAARIFTENEVELMFYASHAVSETAGPMFCYEFEKAVVLYDEHSRDGQITAVFNDGETRDYGDPFENRDNKLWYTLDAIKGKKPVLCGPEAALSQVACINMIHAQIPGAPRFREDLIRKNRDDTGREVSLSVERLKAAFEACYQNWLLPREMGVVL